MRRTLKKDTPKHFCQDCYDKLYKLAQCVCKGLDKSFDPHDLTQHAWFDQARRHEHLTGGDFASAKRAMLQYVIKELRYRSLISELSADMPSDSLPEGLCAPDGQYDRADARMDAAELLSSLGPDDRALIKMKFLEELTETDIANRLGVSKQAVNQRIKKIITDLQKKFKVNEPQGKS